MKGAAPPEFRTSDSKTGMTSESDKLDHMLLEGRDMPDCIKETIVAACAACRGLNERGVRELLMFRTVNKAFQRNVDQVCASADHVSSRRTRTSPRRLCWILS